MEETIEMDGRQVTVEMDDDGDAEVTRVEDERVAEIRELADKHLTNPDDVELAGVKLIGSEIADGPKVMVTLDVPDDIDSYTKSNLFAMGCMDPIIDAGYVPKSVGGTKAWFYPVEDVFDPEDVE